MTEHDGPGEAPRPPKPRTFSFNFSFGKKPPGGDPDLGQLMDRVAGTPESAATGPAELPDGTRVSTDGQAFTLEFADGKLRAGGRPLVEAGTPPRTEDPDVAREAEMWDRLERIAAGKGAYPDTARWHARLDAVVWAVCIAIPLLVLIGTIASGESRETVVLFTFGAAVVAMMIRTSIH